MSVRPMTWDELTGLLEEYLFVTDEWGGCKLAGWQWGSNVVVAGIDEAAEAIMARTESDTLQSELERLTAELAQCRRDYQQYVDGVRTAEQAEIDRLKTELHDCQHERDRYRAAAEQTRGSVAEVDAMLDRWIAEAAERGEG